MKGIGDFQNLFEKDFGNFLDFLGEFFWRHFFGGFSLGGSFLGGSFWRNSFGGITY